MTLLEYMAELKRWYAEHVPAEHWAKPRGWPCLKCGHPLDVASIAVATHDAAFGDACAGWERPSALGVPFCPQCEPAPKPIGCFHLRVNVVTRVC